MTGGRTDKQPYTFQSRKRFLWRVDVAYNNKTYVGLHTSCPGVKKFGGFRRISAKLPNIKSQRRTDRYDEGNRRLSRLFELA
jgi:hypothetical protein